MYQHKVHQSITCTVLQFSVENDIQMWKNTVCCFTMLYVNSLMQIDLFNNNNFSLFAFVLLLTLGYTHPFVCKGCYFIPQEIHLSLTVYQLIDADRSDIHLVLLVTPRIGEKFYCNHCKKSEQKYLL